MTITLLFVLLLLSCTIYKSSAFSHRIYKRAVSSSLFYSEFERTEPPKLSQPKQLDLPIEDAKISPVVEESKEEISKSMKDRLRRELQSQGADPNYSAGPIKGNPILIISAIVAILVVFGGKGIFF